MLDYILIRLIYYFLKCKRCFFKCKNYFAILFGFISKLLRKHLNQILFVLFILRIMNTLLVFTIIPLHFCYLVFFLMVKGNPLKLFFLCSSNSFLEYIILFLFFLSVCFFDMSFRSNIFLLFFSRLLVWNSIYLAWNFGVSTMFLNNCYYLSSM